MFKLVLRKEGRLWQRFSRRSQSTAPRRTSLKNPEYQSAFDQATENPTEYWGKIAKQIHWFKPFDKVLDASDPVFPKWFEGGMTNMSYNALDRHVENGRGDQIALIYDSPVTHTVKKFSFKELRDEVARFAGVLTSLGVTKGDVVVIYMPMVYQASVAMLACSRIGAIHSVVFGGFAPDQLANRIDHSKPKVVISASCSFVHSGTPLYYQPLLAAAFKLAHHQVDHVVMLQRPGYTCEMMSNYIDWDEAISKASPVPCVPVESSHPLYLLYSSGTTGSPKGMVRDTGGYITVLNWSMPNVFGVGPGEVFFAASDIGWVVGHSYIVYGPLIHGATAVLYEGKPVGTPDESAFFRVISEHKVKSFFTAPTAFRSIYKADPEGKAFKKYDLSHFKALFLAGEHSDPHTIQWAENGLNVPVIDNWWQTETGWPMATNYLGYGDSIFPTKYGSVTKPVPGYQISIRNEEGELPRGELGSVVIKLPLPPGCFLTLYKNPQKFRDTYFEKYPGFYDTCDSGVIDEDGYVFVMSRTDDVINVSGVRLSTGALEEVIASNPSVAECAVVGIHDEMRGQVPIGIVVLKDGKDRKEVAKELIQSVRDHIGAVAFFKSVGFVPQLPKTRSGKLLRNVIRNIAEGKPANPPGTIEDLKAVEYVEEALTEMGFPSKEKSTWNEQ